MSNSIQAAYKTLERDVNQKGQCYTTDYGSNMGKRYQQGRDVGSHSPFKLMTTVALWTKQHLEPNGRWI